MSRMFNALSAQFKKQVAEGAGAVAFDGVKCMLPKATFYGACQQDGTPTPESPVPVLCNNSKWTTPVWNQLVQNGNFESEDGWYARDGSLTITNGEAIYTITSLDIGINCMYCKISFPVGHKAFISVYAKGDGGGIVIRANSSGGGASIGYTPFSDISDNVYTRYSGIVDISRSNASLVVSMGYSGAAIGDWVSVKNLMAIDLTDLFGAGNEPSTVEEFEAWCKANGHSLDTYQPYDEGTPIGGTVDLSLLPDGGLYGIGDVQDEWDAVSGDGARLFGKVKMKDLDWRRTVDYGTNPLFFANYNSKKIEAHMMSDIFPLWRIAVSSLASFGNIAPNHSIGNNVGYHRVLLREDDAKTVSELKTLLGEAELIYELDTPTPFHATPQPLIQSNGLNTIQQISGDIADTDVSVEYVKHS